MVLILDCALPFYLLQNGLRNCTVGVFAQHKQKVCVVECGNDLLVAMDAAKVADIIVFVLPLHGGAEGGVNTMGDRIVSAIRAQGIPSTVGVIQGLEGHTPKLQNDLKKYGQRYFTTEFGDAVKVTQANVNAQLSRAIITMTPKTIHWREARSYLLATAAAIIPNGPNEEKGTLQVSGYIRGKPLSVNQLIHITDVGTFQMSHIAMMPVKQVDALGKMELGDDVNQLAAAMLSGQEQHVLATASPELQEDLRYEAEYDPFAAEQTWPTEEELEEAERDAKKKDKDGKQGMSNYQAAWIDGDDEDAMEEEEEQDEDDAEVDQDFCKTGTESVEEDEDEDDISMDEDEDAQRERSYEELKDKRKQERENMTFPDEVDVPGDSSARVRFARYRGLKSLRTSAWDAKESLPREYSRLFQFQDFGHVQRLALERGKIAEKAMKAELRRKSSIARSRASSIVSEMEDVDDLPQQQPLPLAMSAEFGSNGYVPSGVYVTIFIKDVPIQAYNARVQAGPLVMGALLKHENRLSVLNFSIQRSNTFKEPIKSKEELVFHSGFRRFAAKPVYSDQSLKSDQHLFHRFLPQAGWAVASVYGPVTFQPASVLVFRENALVAHELVASGSLMNVNPDRIVLKRVVVTGTPVKVKKRKAVVRYMFHSPEDIRWFKPVELATKHGMTGHIKESLGTHGDFKAVFNKPIKQHDTVCLYLYKRVYPKFVN